MLPLFHIITSNSPSRNMPINDVPVKIKRKNVDVPVHKSHEISQDNRKKNFSANFNSKKIVNKNVDKDDPKFHPAVHTEVVLEIPESDRSLRNSKKQLAKENARLSNENRELVTKFNELEELSVKKIIKLRDKIHALQISNGELDEQNRYVTEQYQALILSYEETQKQLESSRICRNCEELNIALEKYSAENNVLRKNNKELAEDLDMLKIVVYRFVDGN